MLNVLTRTRRALLLPVLAAAALAALTLPGTAAAAGTGTISGQVSGPGGTGVGDVAVTVNDASGNQVTNGFTDTTDSGGVNGTTPLGSYSIPNLAPGVYYVDFDASGATDASGNADNIASQWYGAPAGTAGLSQVNAVQVTVTAGGNVPVSQTLAAGATITGTVTNGATPEGGSVAATGISGGAVPGVDFSATGTTPGAYTITGLPAGTYDLQFTPSDDSWAAGYYTSAGPLADTLSEATSVTVGTGGSATANVSAQTPGVIEGTVTSGGNPIQGVEVDLYDANSNLVEPTRTLPDGTYSLAGLLPGTYKLEFSADQTNLAFQFSGGASTLPTASTITVGAGQTVFTGTNAALTAGGQVVGKVQNAAGTPLAGVDVEIEDASGYLLNDAITAPDGTYTVANLPAGTYYVEFDPAEVPGSTAYQVQYYLGKQVLSGSTPITVTAGATTTGVSATLVPSNTALVPVIQQVAAAIPTDAGTDSISGEVRVGHKLSAKVSGFVSGSSYSYQWYANGKAIKGATASTYTITGGYYKHTIQVLVTGKKSGYNWGVATSKATAKAAEGLLTDKTPKVSGTAKSGDTLKVTVGAWTKGTKFRYQWYAAGKAIKGATKSSLKLAKADEGKAITIKVTGSLTGYKSVAKSSAATKKVAR